MDIMEMLRRLGLDEADAIPSGEDELSFNCLWCEENGEDTPDTKHKFYLHVTEGPKYGKFLCFRCNKRGQVTESAIERERRFRAAPPPTGEPTPTEISQRIYNASDARRAARSSARVAAMPDGFKPILPSMDAWRYLTGRGLTGEDIQYYNLGIARGRIIFPDYLNDQLVYWVGRLYDDSVPGGKYFNAPGVPSKDKLYNLGRFLRAGYPQVIVTEGPISAIIAGRDALATYGKEVTDTQLAMLRALPVERYYVALDPDVKKPQAVAVAHALSQTRRDVFLVNLPARMDPADLGRERFRRLLAHACPYDMYNRTSSFAFLQPFSAWDALEPRASERRNGAAL